jgi:two-component system KDP operon response regulator KdpE
MSGSLILVVDDDTSVREMLARELRAAGHDVETAHDGRHGAELAALHDPALVLTDLSMPVADGFALISMVRASSRVPIVVLSVRGRDEDKVRALDLGADDFICKPFSTAELLARIRAHLRRSTPSPDETMRFPGLTIDLARRRVVQDGRELKLTPTELTLLEHLAKNAGKPLTFDQLITRTWGSIDAASRDTLRVHVGALRRKLEPDPSNPRYVTSEPWVGYRFLAEPE